VDGYAMNFGNLNDFMTIALLRAIPALICITIHELAHGYTAYKLGDNTAKIMGRLTLNPIKHIDPVGLLMMLMVGFGWAKPVPVDMRNFKHPKWYMAITALAGPVSNILLAIVIIFILGFVATPLSDNINDLNSTIYSIISITVFLNIALAIFNMFPIPPLDGSKVIYSLLPEKWYYNILKYERFGMIALLVLIAAQLIFNINILSDTIRYLAGTVENSFFVFFRMGFILYQGLGV